MVPEEYPRIGNLMPAVGWAQWPQSVSIQPQLPATSSPQPSPKIPASTPASRPAVQHLYAVKGKFAAQASAGHMGRMVQVFC